MSFELKMILSALGLIGTLLFADISIERAKEQKRYDQVFKIILAISLILIGVFVNFWYEMYIQYGDFHLVATIALSVVPIFGYAVASIKGTQISLLILLALFIAVAITNIIPTCHLPAGDRLKTVASRFDWYSR